MTALDIRTLTASALFMSVAYQSPAYALTDYLATGTFFGDSLEVFEYVFDPVTDNQEQVGVDAFIEAAPIPLPSSTFSLSFSVDETVDGRVPLFSQSSFFDGAVSKISLDINGTNIFNSATEVATVAQFPGDFGGVLSASWGFSFFPESGGFPLPDVSAIDNNTFEPLGTASAQGLSFRLFDSSRQIYSGDGVSFLDMLTLELNDFDGTSLQLFWFNDFDEEPEFGEEPPEINYTVFASIDSLTNLTAVPLPGGIWLLLSALSGVAVVTRRNQQS